MSNLWGHARSRTQMQWLGLQPQGLFSSLSIRCGLLGAQIGDLAGDAAYLRFDEAHHRVFLVPAARPGILSIEYAVEDVNLLMRNFYVLRAINLAQDPS